MIAAAGLSSPLALLGLMPLPNASGCGATAPA